MTAPQLHAGHSSLQRRCVHLQPGFLSPARCEALLAAVARWRVGHATVLIHRPVRGRDLRYHVIDGDDFSDAIVGAEELVEAVRAEAEAHWRGPLALLDDRRAACNVNITPPGGSYRWHFDRNRVTALLYLNDVGGGQTEVYPNHRIQLGARLPRLQCALDHVAASPALRAAHNARIVIAPNAGTLVLLRGDRALHSVRPVTGAIDRINIVLAFDSPGARRTLPGLDAYLYRTGPVFEGRPRPPSTLGRRAPTPC